MTTAAGGATRRRRKYRDLPQLTHREPHVIHWLQTVLTRRGVAMTEQLESLDVQINRLAARNLATVNAVLHTVGASTTVGTTRANVHCHFLVKDGNRRVLVNDLADSLAMEAVNYCIPRSNVTLALAGGKPQEITAELSRLNREARELFTEITNSGEGGELLIYFLMDRFLGIPQLLAKMPLKTNSSVHYHGADGVHVEALDDRRIAVYWCESKLYEDPTAAVTACPPEYSAVPARRGRRGVPQRRAAGPRQS